jgi:hypothetical protein
LARLQDHGVTELVLDVNTLLSGIDSTIFTESCAEYNDLATILRRPGFRRLDLALLTGRQPYEGDWSAFRSGHLRLALVQATDPEHISLRTDQTDRWPDPSVDPDRHFVPLGTVFPVDKWPRLRHFGLSQFMVRQDDLLSLLAALPATVRSVELSCLIFARGNYRDALSHMRDTLDWRGRRPSERPKLIMATPNGYVSEQTIWVDKEVNDFVYGNGPNPFLPNAFGYVRRGIGVMKDALNPFHERPNLHLRGLADAGYIKHAYNFDGQKIY